MKANHFFLIVLLTLASLVNSNAQEKTINHVVVDRGDGVVSKTRVGVPSIDATVLIKHDGQEIN